MVDGIKLISKRGIASVAKLETMYAVRDKESKQVVRATKCKGGSYYSVRPMCQKRCDEMNKAHNMSSIQSEYEVGEYALVDIDDYKELIKRI